MSSTTAAVRLQVPLSPPQSVAATSALLWEPADRPRSGVAGVVLGHGAGSTMTNPILAAVATGLAAAGHPVLAFNFAYTEAGRRAPDPMPRLQGAFRDAIGCFLARVGRRPLVLGGRSMGGRVASLLAAEGQPCAGLLMLGYPLHPAGRPDKLRVEHWPALKVPVLFVSGTRDTLFRLDLFDEHRTTLPGPVSVHLLDGADHGFRVRRADGRSDADVLADVVDACVTWVGAVA